MSWIYNPGGSGGIKSVATSSALPGGSSGAVYVALDTGIVYAWSTTLGAWVPQGSSSTFSGANLTESTSAVLTITGGANAVNGAGTSIRVKQAGTAQDGYLSATDWNTFNNKLGSYTPPTYTANSVLITNGAGVPIASGVTAAQLAFLLAPENNFGNSGATPSVDLSVSPAQKVTLNANATFAFTNPLSGQAYVLRLVQDGTGSRIATWPAGVKWPGGTAPTLSTAAGAIDLINLYYDGTNYYGSSAIGMA